MKGNQVTDIRDYIELARDMGAFKDIEIDILKETLVAWTERPGDPCSVVELRDGRLLAGFAVFARTQGTDFTWDVRAFCVDSIYRGKGVGQRLAELIEEEILATTDHGIIRVELSKKKEMAVGEGFLLDRDFMLIGHIKGFYELEDDYFIYAKHVTIHEPEIEDRQKSEEKDGASSVHDPAAAPHDPAAASHDPSAAPHDPSAEAHDPSAEAHDPSAEAHDAPPAAKDSPASAHDAAPSLPPGAKAVGGGPAEASQA